MAITTEQAAEAVQNLSDEAKASHLMLVESLLELQAALLNEEPDFPVLLDKINKQLQATPELLHVLSDEQIQPVYTAAMKKTGTHIEVKSSKSKKSKGLLDTGQGLGDLL